MLRTLLIVFILINVIGVPKTSAETIQIKVCSYIDHQPPYFEGHGLEMPALGKRGFIPNSLDEAAKALNIEILWTRLAWKRCVAGFKANKFDALPGAVYTKERHEIAQYPLDQTGKPATELALTPINYHYYENIDKPLGWLGGMKFERSGISIGSPRGFVITKSLQAKGLPIVESLSPLSGMIRLAQGQLDGYVYVHETENILLPQVPNGKEKIRRLDPPIWSSHIYFPVRHELYNAHPALIQKLWKIAAHSVSRQVKELENSVR